MTKFYDTDSEVRWTAGITGRALLWTIIVLVLGGITSAIVWAVSIGTAAPRGRADAYRQQQSGNNRVFQQQAFEQLNADYQSDLTKIGIAKSQVDAATKAGDVQLEGETSVDLVGIENHCVGVANDYNAKSKFYLAAQFKSVDLPEQLNDKACEVQ